MGLNSIENNTVGVTESVSSAYVPSLQLTAGQPAPIAANGGLSYMSFDQDGDAGTAAAIEAAIRQIREGEEQAVIDMIENAPPGPIETKWGRWLSELRRVPGVYSGEQYRSPGRRRRTAAALHRP